MSDSTWLMSVPKNCWNFCGSVCASSESMALRSAPPRSRMSSMGPSSDAAEDASSMRPWFAPTYFEPKRSDCEATPHVSLRVMTSHCLSQRHGDRDRDGGGDRDGDRDRDRDRDGGGDRDRDRDGDRDRDSSARRTSYAGRMA